MTIERPLSQWPLWSATGFCAALCAITVLGMLATYATAGSSNPSMLVVFLCNLPLAFLFAAYPPKNANKRIQELEKRILELETAGGKK